MRHVLSWFQELPEPYKSQAMNNFANQETDNRYARSIYYALLQSFKWKSTPQGYNYWSDLTSKYSKYSD